MDLTPAHLHLMLNHIPVLGPFFLIILMVIGLLRRSREILRAALALTVVLSIATGGVYLTGEPAEEQLENETWFDEDRSHEHEELAEKGLVAAIATGVIALIALAVSRKGVPLKPAMAGLVLMALIACAGLFAAIALTGGPIRHEEIRPVTNGVAV